MADLTDTSNFILAADAHNIGNTTTSWLEPSTWAQKFESAGKFVAVSALSGANSFYTTAQTVGNWFTDDKSEIRDTQTFVSSIDSNLGEYYSQNKEWADIAGFVAGSLIPGLGGTKLFNIGQAALTTARDAGKLGSLMSKATGLLVPRTQMFREASAAQINSSVTAISSMNRNTVLALASGLQQNVLESLAAETLIVSTMGASPVLDNQDGWDIAKNIATGGLLGGVLGGSIEAAKTFGFIKKAKAAEDAQRINFSKPASFRDSTSPADRIIAVADDLEKTAVPIGPLYNEAGELVNNAPVNQTLYANKISSALNKIRTFIHELSGERTELGNSVADMMTPIKDEYGQLTPGHANQYFGTLYNADQIVPVKGVSRLEKEAADAVKNGKPAPNFANRYFTLTGEDAGKVASEEPSVISAMDLYGTKDAVLREASNRNFSLGKDSVLWDASELKATRDGHITSELRNIWVNNILKELPDGMNVHINDIPVLERVFKESKLDINVWNPETLSFSKPSSVNELYGILKESKHRVAANFFEKNVLEKGATKVQKSGGLYRPNALITEETGTEMAAKIANVRRSYLEGRLDNSEWRDLNAYESYAQDYKDALTKRGFTSEATSAVDPRFLPKHAKVPYRTIETNAADGSVQVSPQNLADAMSFYTAKQKLFEQDAKNVFAQVVGKDQDRFPDINQRIISGANRNGDGPTLLAGQNANYGSLGSYMSFIGSQTANLTRNFVKKMQDNLAPALTSMGSKPESAIEWAGINQKISRSKDQFVRLEPGDGSRFLISKRAKAAIEGDSEGLTTINDLGPEDLILVKHDETWSFIQAHTGETGSRTKNMQLINAQQGRSNARDSEVVRPIRPDLRNYQHFSFVVDSKVTETGHKTMLHAASAKELSELEDKVRSLGGRYKVVNKSDIEEYKTARQEYEYSRGMNENYIDSDLANQGIFSNFFPQSDPKRIVDDILVQHTRETQVLAKEAVRLRYQPIFDSLTDLGTQYSKTETSKFGSRISQIEGAQNNPYLNYVKTALDISKVNEHPLLFGAAQLLDSAFSKASRAINEVWNGVGTPKDLDKINGALDEFGIKPAYYDASLHALVNHTAPRGELTKFVRGANSLLSLFTLGLDPLNALNNAIGANILRGTELRNLTKAIAGGNAEVAGELAQLGKIGVPGTDSSILSPAKLMGNAVKNFFNDMSDPAKPLINRYRDAGFIKDRLEQFGLLVDDFTLKGTESVSELNKRLNTAFGRAKSITETVQTQGEKYSGNKFAEEFNRFISANVMDQLTSLGVKHGLMDNAESLAYINTFVNRVEGNMIASQRPLVFQGPIGQAIGLFQSYQFNLMQQLFRYVGEGQSKDAAMLLGLQGTLYGAQSMPGFQFVNAHILGTASGNTKHKDAYDAAYGIGGKTLGEFFLYGAPSAILQTNIYSRGDINPRQITVLPTSLLEVPFINGWGKFFGNVYETSSKLLQGGSAWQTLLQGLEHNGVSRPLAGIAQVMQGITTGTVYSTTNQGSMLYSHDLASWASISRLAGGRPLDEAVTNDALFRIKSYEASDKANLKGLAETVKTSLIGGNHPSESQIQQFAQEYAKKGGKQMQFNKYMMDLYKTANVSQATQLEQNLKNPFSYKMQLMMGGED